MPRRAIFFDRDGTLCEQDRSVAAREPLRPVPSAAAAIRRFNSHGWQVVVLTDQPGIAFGDFDEDALAETHEQLRLLLLAEGARLDGIYHCPHHPEGKIERYRRECDCRRPGTALFERARDEMGIDLANSFFFGGSADALRAAAACGLKAVRVHNGRDSLDDAAERALRGHAPSVVPA